MCGAALSWLFRDLKIINGEIATETIYAFGLGFLLISYFIGVLFIDRSAENNRFDLHRGKKVLRLIIMLFLSLAYSAFGWILFDLISLYWRGHGVS